MNRADQAPEPSMEELLASIRLIISDADRNGQKGPVYSGAAAADSASAAHAALPHADEVFDLSDEFAFPDSGEASPATQNGRLASAEPDDAPASQMHAAPRRPAPSNLPPLPTAPQTSPVRLERQKQSPPPVTRPIWSGRELQPAGAPSQHAAPKPREESNPVRPQAKNWAADIQLPIPEQGPVSLFSTHPAKEPQTAEAVATGEHAFDAAAASGNAEGTVAVAALAQRLARSAIGVLQASELETATQVDFEHLDADSKAEVSEKFADAIERESAAHGPGALTAPLDSAIAEVRKQSAPSQDLLGKAPKSGGETAAQPEAQVSPKQEARSEPAGSEREPIPQRPSPQGGAPQPSRQAPANPVPARPLAHAQFAGHAQLPVPAQTGKTLEEAVREMLRPLLVQWLNENMPRILENAIREEIAGR